MSSRSRISGNAMILTISALRRWTIAFGVPAGTKIPATTPVREFEQLVSRQSGAQNARKANKKFL